jgi:hypothetical protein
VRTGEVAQYVQALLGFFDVFDYRQRVLTVRCARLGADGRATGQAAHPQTLGASRSWSATLRMKRMKRSSSNVWTASKPYLARMYSSRLTIKASAGSSRLEVVVMQFPPRAARSECAVLVSRVATSRA